MTRVYIGNLEDGTSKRELEKEMEGFGSLRDVWVARNPPGFAFVVFEDRRDAESAVRHLDGRRLCGCRVRVEIARGPTRGGRAARLGLREKCYECGRIGHFARDCTRGPGDGDQRAQRRSRSRSPPRKRRSRSRSYSPRRKKSQSRSQSRSRSYSRSRSGSKEAKSDSEEQKTRRSSEKTADQESDQEQSKNGADAEGNDPDDEGSDDQVQTKDEANDN